MKEDKAIEGKEKITGEVEEKTNEERKCLKLKKPIKIDGKLVEEIYYDYEDITGEQIDKILRICEREATENGGTIVVFQLDSSVQARTFAEAAGIDIADMKRMGSFDYLKALTASRVFFTTGSNGSQNEEV